MIHAHGVILDQISTLLLTATLAVSWAARPYPDTSHQRLLHHLGQLASWPPYITSTASAKPWLDGLGHGTSPVLSIAVSLSLHINMTVSASSDGLGFRSLSPLCLSLAAHLRPTSALVPGLPATCCLLEKGAE
ncbi:hypothetical protein C0995_013282 [Termitomyces sp. Mi166|nr:hypothetical protein C0995_013282 [Termitomyces sp. Mi166\